MSIDSYLIRGHTDAIILSCLSRGDSYGYQINKMIQQKTENRYELKEATLYSAFKRLEDSGCISSYWGDENSGARRRYYRISNLGTETLRTLKQEWSSAKKIIDTLIEEA